VSVREVTLASISNLTGTRRIASIVTDERALS
jgi:hypothetical protein